MRMNRRNVLFVLGTTILLGGVLIASGAFSQVQAERTVSVQTEGDADAALELEINDNVDHAGVENIGGKAIELEFSDVNDNATIHYDDVLNVSNGDNEAISVKAYSNSSAIEVYNSTEDRPTDFSTDSANVANLGTITTSDETETLGIALNTSDSSINDDSTITIEAERDT